MTFTSRMEETTKRLNTCSKCCAYPLRDIFPIKSSSQSNVSPLVKILIMYLKAHCCAICPSAWHGTPSARCTIPGRLQLSALADPQGRTNTSKLFQGPSFIFFSPSREGHVCACIPAFEGLSHSHSTDGLGSSTKACNRDSHYRRTQSPVSVRAFVYVG